MHANNHGFSLVYLVKFGTEIVEEAFSGGLGYEWPVKAEMCDSSPDLD
jgi:hypothetical protein